MQEEQSHLFDTPSVQSVRYPIMIVHDLNDKETAVRFWNIGGRSRFLTLLQRFRAEFLLARAEKLNGLDWLILMKTQRPEINDFCRRYGLVIEEG
jgi:hypothetical protein